MSALGADIFPCLQIDYIHFLLLLFFRRQGYLLAKAYYGPGKGPIWLDDVGCYGHEQSISDCYHLPWGSYDCSHNEDVSISCIGSAPTIGNNTNSSCYGAGEAQVSIPKRPVSKTAHCHVNKKAVLSQGRFVPWLFWSFPIIGVLHLSVKALHGTLVRVFTRY